MSKQNLKSRKPALSLLILYFLKLGTTGFGGPIALIHFMERDLVGKKKWLTKEEYKRGLTLSQLSPGPMATQLALYIGYIRYGILGTTLVGLFFILPSFIMVVVIGFLYLKFGSLSFIKALFTAVSASVIGIIISSSLKLTQKNVGGRKLLWIIFTVMFIATVYTKTENVWLLLAAGIFTVIIYNPPEFKSFPGVFTLPMLSAPLTFIGIKSLPLLARLLVYFTKAGFLVFGSGMAIVPFLYGGVVLQNHWLTQKQFVDAVAVAMITPGPAVITVGFIGYLVAGFWGAVAASAGVFLPIYLIIIAVTPFYEKIAHRKTVVDFVEGITAGATGAIAGSVVVLGTQSVKDLTTFFISLGTFLAIYKWKIKEPIIILLAGLLGLLLYR